VRLKLPCSMNGSFFFPSLYTTFEFLSSDFDFSPSRRSSLTGEAALVVDVPEPFFFFTHPRPFTTARLLPQSFRRPTSQKNKSCKLPSQFRESALFFPFPQFKNPADFKLLRKLQRFFGSFFLPSPFYDSCKHFLPSLKNAPLFPFASDTKVVTPLPLQSTSAEGAGSRLHRTNKEYKKMNLPLRKGPFSLIHQNLTRRHLGLKKGGVFFLGQRLGRTVPWSSGYLGERHFNSTPSLD